MRARIRARRARIGVACRRHLPRPLGVRGAAPLSVVVVVAGLLLGSVAIGGTDARATLARPHRLSANLTPGARMEQEFGTNAPPLQLPVASAPPAPAPPTLADAPPLQSHEIFGFAPWWNLAGEASYDVKDMTTLAYFSVDINADGSADQSGSGWVGYQSQALADLITRAHAANDRVVLTATCFDQHTLDQLTSDPSAPGRLGTTLVQLISAKNLDGVNFDFEGKGPQDQRGLDNLIAAVSGQLRAANPHWQVTMSTYASSAGDSNGFYDIAGLNPSVDAFFVMAYDMNDPSTPSPTAPLTGSGNNDNVDLAEYSAVVPRSKIILGVPYYGYDWPTAGPNQGDPATGAPTPISYAQVAATGGPSYWDRASDTPWTAYQSGSQWHQVWFDDPTSLALKARLANSYRIAGLGVWALGMDGNDPAMLAALLGMAPAAKYLNGPEAGAASISPGSSGAPGVSAGSPNAGPPQYSYGGLWNGTRESLQPVNPSTLPGGGSGRSAGTLQDFTTNDPAASCLSGGKPLPVIELAASPDTYVVQANTPTYCAAGTWEFTAPPTAGTNTGSGGGGGGSTPTTAPPSSTTTTTSPPLTVPVVTKPTTSTTSSSTQPGLHL
ncbi:MAG: glycosyl hydrolase family 18 protein [Acidimicrobiales bacterium]